MAQVRASVDCAFSLQKDILSDEIKEPFGRITYDIKGVLHV